ncbi:MAG TPA: CFI-box-CTERM domain-containing protein [Nitrososphaera sp.]|nr:CFI-box-CTERM domain-containing protein [Nitrososphaera sp.]
MYITLKRYSVSLTLLFVVIISCTVITYGHGLGTDTSPSIAISDKQVSVEASLYPTFLDQVPTSKPTFIVRALEGDPSRNTTLQNVDFRIVVELNDEILLDQRFRSSDGIVNANLIPEQDIQGWEVNGQADPSTPVEVSQGTPVELRSRILTAGGLYHIVAIIENSSPGLTMQADQQFDLYVSIGSSYIFNVQTAQSEEQMVVKSYYDEIGNFSYSNKTIKFETPFTWDRAYVDQVPVLHMEVQFPKTIEELQTNSYSGTLNGEELEAQAVVIDDYTSEQNRIVHFVINNPMLSRISERINDNNVAVFTLAPVDRPKFPLDILSLPGESFLFQLSWGPDIIETGVPITFVMNIQDPATGDLLRGSSFDFVLLQDGNEIHNNHMSSDFGTYSYDYTFSNAGRVTLAANNINGQGESAKIDLVVQQGSSSNPNPQPQPSQSQCLIATATFGSELAPQVQYLRHFRDSYILSTASGAAFMKVFDSVYYSFSPQVAEYERGQPWMQSTVKLALYPLFGILIGAEYIHSVVGGGEIGAIMAGIVSSVLIGVIYLAPLGYLASRFNLRNINRLLAIFVCVATAILSITVVALDVLLPLSTVMFVLVITAASAITAARAIKYLVHRW